MKILLFAAGYLAFDLLFGSLIVKYLTMPAIAALRAALGGH